MLELYQRVPQGWFPELPAEPEKVREEKRVCAEIYIIKKQLIKKV